MIVVLCEEDSKDIARAICEDLAIAYDNKLETCIIIPDGSIKWPSEPEWDDLLIILFNDSTASANAAKFITDYCSRGDKHFLLPIFLDDKHKKPPDPISGIKALYYDIKDRGKDSHIIKRVGALIGLRIRHRDHKIFISYRAIDGKKIADQLNDYLKQNGFNPWLDEAKDEYDEEGSIQGGEDVQAIIEKNLAEANLVLLIDTLGAIDSKWIKLEIDSSIAQLIPVLPICCKQIDDPTKGPRFRSLRELQRWVEVKPCTGDELDESKLKEIMSEIEDYLCEIYKRKLRVPFLVKKQFITRGFTWEFFNKKINIYKSERQHTKTIKHTVISHCSIFNQVYVSILKIVLGNISGLRANFLLFIYDGEIIPEHEILGICSDTEGEALGLIIIHHQQIPILLDSDFKTVS